ncbi:Saposin B-type domain-containing protein [Mycena venus]|uniref:Saposin B-type domain-containing protein n=1 Tax=Mycena venus TaxID=2733690 RepID=A0A8H6Y8G8_9AGAR|nr:Saposin B-type domain-containing protein [Mycena venus]
MAAVPPKLPPLDGSLGVIQIGLVLGTFLFGIETLQTFNYYREFPKDPKILKGLVGGIWFFELAHTISSWHAMYTITVTFYGQPQHILAPPISLVYPIFFHGLIAFCAQSFFVYRVRVLSGQWLIPIGCFALNLARLGCLMLLFGELYQTPIFTLLATKFRKEVIVVSSMGPGVEIVVAASLVYYLWSRRGGKGGSTGFQQTNRVVDSIVIWTVETTLITTVSGVVQLILFLTRRNDSSWILFFLIQAKLFSNSLLASLNGRTRFRTPGASVVAYDSAGHSNSTGRSAPGAFVAANPSDVVIRMHQMSDTVYSDDMLRSKV